MCQRPFFFKHDQCAHFVVPKPVIRPIIHMARPDLMDPSWLDSKALARYIDKYAPVLPDFNKPYPQPEVAGGLRYLAYATTSRFAVENLITRTKPLQQRLRTLQTDQQQLLPSTGLLSSLTALRTTPIVWKPGAGLPNVVGEKRQIRAAPVRTTDIGAPLIQFARKIPALCATKPAASSRLIDANITPIYNRMLPPTFFQFSLAYRPFVKEFLLHLNRDGIDGLMQRPLQLSHSPSFQNYQPSFAVSSVSGRYADEVVDFDDGLYAVYNWNYSTTSRC